MANPKKNYQVGKDPKPIFENEEGWTTQKVADFLNVSRPFVVKLMDSGKLRCFKVGNQRRVTKQEAERFKSQMRVTQRQALDELSEEARALGQNFGFKGNIVFDNRLPIPAVKAFFVSFFKGDQAVRTIERGPSAPITSWDRIDSPLARWVTQPFSVRSTPTTVVERRKGLPESRSLLSSAFSMNDCPSIRKCLAKYRNALE